MEGFGGGKLLHGPLAEQFISVLVEAFFLPGLQGKELFRGESVGSILRGATKKQVVTRQIELPHVLRLQRVQKFDAVKTACGDDIAQPLHQAVRVAAQRAAKLKPAGLLGKLCAANQSRRGEGLAEQLAAATGYDKTQQGGTSQSAKAGGFTAMTQDQGTKLEGMFTGGLQHWSSMDDQLESVSEKMDTAEGHLARIAENTGVSAGHLGEIKDEIKKMIRDGLKVK